MTTQSTAPIKLYNIVFARVILGQLLLYRGLGHFGPVAGHKITIYDCIVLLLLLSHIRLTNLNLVSCLTISYNYIDLSSQLSDYFLFRPTPQEAKKWSEKFENLLADPSKLSR